MKLKLPVVVLAMLKKRGGTMDAGLRATRARLIKTCEDHKYPPHTSVIAFEAAFGGLIIPDELKQKKGEPCWLFGTHACLTTGGHMAPRGGSKARKLVPVVYSPNDIIYYLDEQGRGYAEDTIEDPSATFYADNGTSLVCRIVFNDALFSREETSLDLPGLQGEELSKRLSLTLVTEASGKDLRFFSDAKGDVLVVEEIKAKRTRFASATKKQLKLVKQPVASNKPAPELIPFLGKASVRMVSEQCASLPEFFEHLPDLRELDVSINRLTTLPESLWRATQLTNLDLSFNPLKALPDGIGNMKSLTSLSLRRCLIKTLPDALAGAKNITSLIVTECEELDVDAALLVIAKLPKLQKLWLPLSRSLTSLSPLAQLPLKSLYLNGTYVQRPSRLPAGFGQLKKLTDLRIEYADDIAQLPEAPEDVQALRLLFSKRFSDDDIRKSALKQPEKLYLRAFAGTL
ncbi:MAG: leucine-rich repeat domain-containing protein [Cyclobacteriaceae bacterium]